VFFHAFSISYQQKQEVVADGVQST